MSNVRATLYDLIVWLNAKLVMIDDEGHYRGDTAPRLQFTVHYMLYYTIIVYYILVSRFCS